jgi:hypothetical protein
LYLCVSVYYGTDFAEDDGVLFVVHRPRYAEVESHCSRAVWVYQQLNQPSNSKPVITATTMQALALVLLGRANEAEQLATSCLEAAKQMPGSASERNSFVASCQNCLGEVLREMGRVADADAAAREGLAIREKVGMTAISRLLFASWGRGADAGGRNGFSCSVWRMWLPGVQKDMLRGAVVMLHASCH